MTQPQLLPIRFPDEHILDVLMIRGTKYGLAFFQPVELMAFESLDQGCGIRAAGSLNGFKDLRHRGIAQIAA